MAKNHGLLNYEMSNATFDPVVYVGTADAGPSWSDNDIVWGGEFRNGSIFVDDFVLGFEDERRVLRVC
jgi:hypothetical protein